MNPQSNKIKVAIALSGLIGLANNVDSGTDAITKTSAAAPQPNRSSFNLLPFTNQVPPEIPNELKKGYELAHVYCQACHLFPEPNLLDKKTWRNGALRKMAPLLGVGRINLESRADGKILQEAGIFPASPLVSESDWRAICNYYEQSAPEKPLPQGPRPKIQMGLKQFQLKELKYQSPIPMTTLVKIDPARKRLYVGDAQNKTLDVLNAAGELVSRITLASAPVSLTAKPEGLYVTLIGHVFPSDERDGQLVLLEETGDQFKVHPILDKLQRPTNTTFADLNNDGREDFVLSAFGNYLGRFSWFENLGGGKCREQFLFERPGAICSYVYDANKDGLPDIFVLMGQAKEGVYLFTNQGKGIFQETPLVEFHPLFGSTYFELADFNGDGFLDILATNGDNGDYPSPFKNYHGIRIYLNDGKNHFQEAWFYPLNGAFKAMAADFDHDGDLDVAAISFFPDYDHSPEESFVYLENKGGLKFEAYSFSESPTGRWLTMDVNDLDGDGDLDIVLGSFSQGPHSIPIPPSLQAKWNTNGVSVLFLENKLR